MFTFFVLMTFYDDTSLFQKMIKEKQLFQKKTKKNNNNKKSSREHEVG